MQKDEKTLVTTWVFLSVTRKDTLQKFILTNMKSKPIKGPYTYLSLRMLSVQIFLSFQALVQ